jgi:excinuclease ABC subunit A
MSNLYLSGARENNLQGVELSLPHHKLVVITGPSGSGKSSLVFDTLFAESQRRYMETLSPSMRGAARELPAPDVDCVFGLPPAVALRQGGWAGNVRSTVGTVSHAYDYLRTLYANLGEPHCLSCHAVVRAQRVDEITAAILRHHADQKIEILAPLSPFTRKPGSAWRGTLAEVLASGFVRVRVQDELCDLSEQVTLHDSREVQVSVVVDRVQARAESSARVHDAVVLSSKVGDGWVEVRTEGGERRLFSQRLACTQCGTSLDSAARVSPAWFSYNHPSGACAACEGLGTLQPKPAVTKSAKHDDDDEPPDDEPCGAANDAGHATCPVCEGARLCARSLAFHVEGKSLGDLARLPLTEVLSWLDRLGAHVGSRGYLSVVTSIQTRLRFLVRMGLGDVSLFRSVRQLSAGQNARVRLAAVLGNSLVYVAYLLDEPTVGLHPEDTAELIAALRDIRDQGNTVIVVEHDQDVIDAADYVVRLGPGGGARGGRVVQVLDRTQGTRAAQGTSSAAGLAADSTRATHRGFDVAASAGDGWYRMGFMGSRAVAEPSKSLQTNHDGSSARDFDARIMKAAMNCVVGASGSGKSTMLQQLWREVRGSLDARRVARAASKRASVKPPGSGEHPPPAPSPTAEFGDVVWIDDRPLGRSNASMPATYVGVFQPMRELFSALPDARVRGFRPAWFALHVKGGRCEACSGLGVSRVSLQLLPDVLQGCEVCKGQRYSGEALQIRYRGHSIADCLQLTVDDAVELFAAHPSMGSTLRVMQQVGLGYLRIGQHGATLSGGEAQRLRLSKGLARAWSTSTLLLMDEPTVGLDDAEVATLRQVLWMLTQQGHTVVVAEHHARMIASADHIVELDAIAADEAVAGAKIGRVIGQGHPTAIAVDPDSRIGPFLRRWLPGAVPSGKG